MELGKTSGREVGHCGNGGEPVVHDGKMGTGGLLLGVLESVDVLGDTGIVGPPTKHCCLEVHNISGFEAATARGEVVQVSADLDLVVEG